MKRVLDKFQKLARSGLFVIVVMTTACTSSESKDDSSKKGKSPTGTPSPKNPKTKPKPTNSQRLRSAPANETEAKATVKEDFHAFVTAFDQALASGGPEATGLKNLGSACYANAANKLIWAMAAGSTTGHPLVSDVTQTARYPKVDPSLSGFESYTRHLMEGIEDYFFSQSSKGLDGVNPLIGYQHDSSEYLKKLLNLLDSEKKYRGITRATQIVFDDGLKKQKDSRDVSHSYTLFIQKPEIKSLSDAIVEFLASERLENVERDDGTGKREDATRNAHFEADFVHLPTHLFFNLNRFGNDGGNPSKISKTISVPSHFNIQLQNSQTTDGKVYELPMKLTGAVIHLGGMNSGHYLAWILHPNADGTETWFRHNDSSVTRYSETEALSAMSKDGYILLYQVVGSPTPIKSSSDSSASNSSTPNFTETRALHETEHYQKIDRPLLGLPVKPEFSEFKAPRGFTFEALGSHKDKTGRSGLPLHFTDILRGADFGESPDYHPDRARAVFGLMHQMGHLWSDDQLEDVFLNGLFNFYFRTFTGYHWDETKTFSYSGINFVLDFKTFESILSEPPRRSIFYAQLASVLKQDSTARENFKNNSVINSYGFEQSSRFCRDCSGFELRAWLQEASQELKKNPILSALGGRFQKQKVRVEQLQKLAGEGKISDMKIITQEDQHLELQQHLIAQWIHSVAMELFVQWSLSVGKGDFDPQKSKYPDPKQNAFIQNLSRLKISQLNEPEWVKALYLLELHQF